MALNAFQHTNSAASVWLGNFPPDGWPGAGTARVSLSPHRKKHHPCQKPPVFFYIFWRRTATRERL